jgi:hypothetical protein
VRCGSFSPLLLIQRAAAASARLPQLPMLHASLLSHSVFFLFLHFLLLSF